MDTRLDQLAGKRILLVEDMDLVAREVKLMLESFGCEVVGPAPDLAKGLAAAEDRLDGAVLDVNLEGEESYPIADRLRQRRVKFIFTTGYGVQSLEKAYQSYPSISKPFSAEELGALMLRVFIEQPQLAKSGREA